MRNNLFGRSEATYSGYTCYTGIADFVPADIESVGYVAVRLNLMHLFSDYDLFLILGLFHSLLKLPGFLGTQTVLCVFGCWWWKNAMVCISRGSSWWG